MGFISRTILGNLTGLKEFTIDSTRPNGIECFECQSIGETEVVKRLRTWHIVHLFMLPVGLRQEIRCTRCQASLAFKEMDPDTRKQYQSFRLSNRIPIWAFSMILLFGFIFFWTQYNRSKKLAIMLQRAEELKVNQILDTRNENGSYSSFKVCKIDSQNIWAVDNLYEVQSANQLDLLNEQNAFSQDTFIVSRRRIMADIQSGSILEVHW
ncbi:MAG: hypothetical protein AAF206_02170 [Bacteroidota bacterium]